MSIVLFECSGGEIALPDRKLTLVSREDGGHLIINPPRAVWDRSELSPKELTRWGFLVAATAKAMMTVLPQLARGCINYWDAGNWAVHDEAEPPRAKSPVTHRRVHLHLLGRSRNAADPAWRWGESPKWPDFRDRIAWAATHQPLTADECSTIVSSTSELLHTVYGLGPADLEP
jgi:diadenosine tetraphosphate (Ap4A) HIT family hydrolase